MPLQYFAGQRLTADQLQLAVPERISQSSSQNVTSSITPVDSNLTVTISDLTHINMDARYETTGGGFRWVWKATGSIVTTSRTVMTSGRTITSGTIFDIPEMQYFNFDSLTSAATVEDWTTSNSQRLSEELLVDGSGTLTFQFAQETSNAGATTLRGESHMIVTRMGV